MENNSQIARLTIKSAQFYGYHGVKDEEKTLGGRYEVDLDLWYDATNAIATDDVTYALNYEKAMECIEDVFSGQSYNLIETVANNILEQLFERFPFLSRAAVRIRKINVPIHSVVSFIEIELERKA